MSERCGVCTVARRCDLTVARRRLFIYTQQQAKLIPIELHEGAAWLYGAAALLLAADVGAERVARRVLRQRALDRHVRDVSMMHDACVDLREERAAPLETEV